MTSPSDSTSGAVRFVSWATLRDMAIVVVSILIAFALDAWWDRTSARRELLDQLPLVIEEMTATREALDQALWAHQRQAGLAGGLSDALRAAADPGAVVVSDSLVGPLFPQFTMDVSTASLEGFIDAGGLTLVADRDVRARLRAWPTEIEDARDDEIFLRTFPQAELGTYLRANFPVAGAELIGIEWMLTSRPGSTEPRDALLLGHTTLRAEDTLLNLLAARHTHERAMVRTLTPLRRSSGELVEALAGIR